MTDENKKPDVENEEELEEITDENAPDILVCEDEDGNEVLLQVRYYFFHNGVEYALLSDYVEGEEEDDEEFELDDDRTYVIMKVNKLSETEEEFEEVEDDELYEELITIAQTQYEEAMYGEFADAEDPDDDVF